MARSRSSMTAEIFRRHGVFFGDTTRPEDGGIDYNEHPVFKKSAREIRGHRMYDKLLRGAKKPRLYPGDVDWRGILEADGYSGGPWGFKVDAFCWPLFEGARFICLRRARAAILRSCQKAIQGFGYTEEDWGKIIDAHRAEMRHRGASIDTDDLVAGQMSGLQAAFQTCGLEYNHKIAKDVIEC